MESFSRLLERAKELHVITRVMLGNENSKIEVSHLFFADDGIIFCQPGESTMLQLGYIFKWCWD